MMVLATSTATSIVLLITAAVAGVTFGWAIRVLFLGRRK